MARDMRIRVAIDGEESVSGAVKKANTSLSGFANKVKDWTKGVTDIRSAWDTLKSAVSIVTDFVGQSSDAFDAYMLSQRRLEAQSKLTGIPIAELTRLQKLARTEFQLGETTAADAASMVGRYASAAGDASKAQELMSASLKLGRAQGLSAAEAIEAMNMGLRGQDEGFDKLLNGKNPSVLWKEYAEANGLAVGKMTDAQKKMAELSAVIEAASKLGDDHNESMLTGARQSQLLSNAITEQKVATGKAIEPLRTLVLQGLVAFVNTAGPVLSAGFRIINMVGSGLVGAFNAAQLGVGKVVEGIGKLTGNERLQQWGKDYAESAKKDLQSIVEAVANADRAIDMSTTTVVTANEKRARSSEDASKKTEAALAREAKAAAKHEEEMYRTLFALSRNVDTATLSLERLGEKATLALPPGVAAEFTAKMKEAGEKAQQVALNLKPVPESIKEGGREISTLYRGALDTATAFGVIDRTAANALTSAGNMADAIGRMAATGLSFAGVTGVLGGIANIVSVMMQGDAERRRLIRDNSEALRQHGRSLDRANRPGGEITSIQAALSQFMNTPAFSMQFGVSSQQRIAGLMLALGNNNASMDQLEALARNLGVSLRDREGRLSTDAIRQLFEFLQQSTTASDASPEGQLQQLRDRLRVDGASQGGILEALGAFFARQSDALRGVVDVNNLDQTRINLRSLLDAVDGGSLGQSNFGGLSRTQFREALLELLGLTNDLRAAGASGASTSAPPSTASSAPGPSVDVGMGVSPGVAQDVLQGFRTATADMTAQLTLSNAALARIADNSDLQVEQLEKAVSLLERLRGFTIDEVSAALASQTIAQQRFSGQVGVN
jgi:uncharacterized protein YjbJ (UPF0337 family)